MVVNADKLRCYVSHNTSFLLCLLNLYYVYDIMKSGVKIGGRK